MRKINYDRYDFATAKNIFKFHQKYYLHMIAKLTIQIISDYGYLIWTDDNTPKKIDNISGCTYSYPGEFTIEWEEHSDDTYRVFLYENERDYKSLLFSALLSFRDIDYDIASDYTDSTDFKYVYDVMKELYDNYGKDSKETTKEEEVLCR